MKRRAFARSCLLFLLLSGAGILLVLFVVSVIFSQAQAGTQKSEATAHPTERTFVPPTLTSDFSVTAAIPMVGVTIESGPTTVPSPAVDGASPTATSFSAGVLSATPGPAPLGTLDYPLTVTAEAYTAATKVAKFLNSVDATRTANAQEAEIAHVTLTAAAATK
jgi:hypothetical protein